MIAFLFLVTGTAFTGAQEQDKPQVSLPPGGDMRNLLPRFKGRAVVMEINARILDNGEVIWNETNKKITIPGRPVEIKLIGENLVVVVRFTFIRSHNGGQKLLVAQGQVWTADSNQGIRYQASVQTIPLEFDETVYYFPLGSLNPSGGGASGGGGSPGGGDSSAGSSIEVMLTLRPYEE